MDNRLIEQSFLEFHTQLVRLATQHLNPVLAQRVTPEDVVQETFLAACKRVNYFEANPEVPVYCKLRKLLFQTLSDLDRKHLQAQKRDAYKELCVGGDTTASAAQVNWNMFADTLTNPLSKLTRQERYGLLQTVLEHLSENDRQILELRHFDGMSNADCAAVLNITPKTASIRYVRALERLRTKTAELSEFGL